MNKSLIIVTFTGNPSFCFRGSNRFYLLNVTYKWNIRDFTETLHALEKNIFSLLRLAVFPFFRNSRRRWWEGDWSRKKNLWDFHLSFCTDRKRKSKRRIWRKDPRRLFNTPYFFSLRPSDLLLRTSTTPRPKRVRRKGRTEVPPETLPPFRKEGNPRLQRSNHTQLVIQERERKGKQNRTRT